MWPTVDVQTSYLVGEQADCLDLKFGVFLPADDLPQKFLRLLRLILCENEEGALFEPFGLLAFQYLLEDWQRI